MDSTAKRILISGASGLIGTRLTGLLHEAGCEVRTLVRRESEADTEWRWQPERHVVPAEAIEWADVLIGLSGASLSKLPWTKSYRQKILDSRLDTTTTLANAISNAAHPPEAWVNASAVGYYGDRPGERLTEESEAGSGFLADVVRQWEAATEQAEERTRVVHARTGLVLANGGALKPLILATRLGAGAAIGPGTQHWPWIALEDEAAALAHLALRSQLSGPVNLASPQAATSEEVTRALAAQMRRPHIFRLPAWLLKTTLGLPAEELLLADQLSVSGRLQEDGFAFGLSSLAEALESELG